MSLFSSIGSFATGGGLAQTTKAIGGIASVYGGIRASRDQSKLASAQRRLMSQQARREAELFKLQLKQMRDQEVALKQDAERERYSQLFRTLGESGGGGMNLSLILLLLVMSK